jgi:hypothetical protein
MLHIIIPELFNLSKAEKNEKNFYIQDLMTVLTQSPKRDDSQNTWVPSEDKTYSKTLLKVSSPMEDFDPQKSAISIHSRLAKNQKNRNILITSRDELENGHDTNVFAIAVPYNGSLVPLGVSNENFGKDFRIWKGLTIHPTDPIDFDDDNTRYMRIFYAVITPSLHALLTTKEGEHKDEISMKIESYFNSREEEDKSTKNTFTLSCHLDENKQLVSEYRIDQEITTYFDPTQYKDMKLFEPYVPPTFDEISKNDKKLSIKINRH